MHILRFSDVKIKEQKDISTVMFTSYAPVIYRRPSFCGRRCSRLEQCSSISRLQHHCLSSAAARRRTCLGAAIPLTEVTRSHNSYWSEDRLVWPSKSAYSYLSPFKKRM